MRCGIASVRACARLHPPIKHTFAWFIFNILCIRGWEIQWECVCACVFLPQSISIANESIQYHQWIYLIFVQRLTLHAAYQVEINFQLLSLTVPNFAQMFAAWIGFGFGTHITFTLLLLLRTAMASLLMNFVKCSQIGWLKWYHKCHAISPDKKKCITWND